MTWGEGTGPVCPAELTVLDCPFVLVGAAGEAAAALEAEPLAITPFARGKGF